MATNPHLPPLLSALRRQAAQAPGAWGKTAVARHLGVSTHTYKSWGVDPDKFKAGAAHKLATTFDLGGLALLAYPEESSSFADLHHALAQATKDKRVNYSTLAGILVLSAGHAAKFYPTDADYAERNLTVKQMDDWARAVGLGGVTTVGKELYNRLLVGLFNCVDPEQPEIAPLHTPPAVVVDDRPSDVVLGGRIRALVADYREAAGLHLPLTYLLRVLKAERERMGLSLRAMPSVTHEQLLGEWESGYILHPPRRVSSDLTLGALDRWAQELGFGRVLCPALGYDWPLAMSTLLATVRVGAGLDMTRLGALLGCGPQRASEILRGPWQHIPAAYFEYLSLWAYADGLAFEHGKGRRGWTPEQAQAAVAYARDRLHRSAARRQGSTPLRQLVSTQGGYARFTPVEVTDYKQANTLDK